MSTNMQTEQPKGLVGPITIRDIVVVVAAIGLLVLSFFPLYTMKISDLQGPLSVWQSGPMVFIPGVLLAVAAAALLVYRRFGKTELRLGSFSTDQLVSIFGIITLAFFATLPFTLQAWSKITSIADGSQIMSINTVPGYWWSLALAAVLFVGTTLAYRLPAFSKDFAGRAEVPAHIVARPSAPVAKPAPRQKTPKAPKGRKDNAEAQLAGGAAAAGTATFASHEMQQAQQAEAGSTPRGYDARSASQVVDGQQATAQGEAAQSQGQGGQVLEQEDSSAAPQPFWFAVPESRQIVDENTGTASELVPGEWHLALEDRGNSFLVQSGDTQQTGVLNNLADIQRA